MENQELAGRWARLGAAILDGIISTVISLPVMFYLGVFDNIQEGALSFGLTLKLSLFGFIIFLLLHGYLLSNYGQTIGKKLLGIKIVDMNGEKPEFNSLIAKRYLPLWLITLVPIIGQIVPLVDALFIFRDDKRCIHDLIAGTQVVEYKSFSLDEKSDSNPF